MCSVTMYGEVSSEFSEEEQEDLRKQKDSVCFDYLPPHARDFSRELGGTG